MTELTLFCSSFLVVFLLIIQSLNVNNGHRFLATITSFGIGSVNLLILKLAPDANWTEMAAFILGGPIAVNAAMAAHPLIVLALRRKS
jgi:hypothetical protein